MKIVLDSNTLLIALGRKSRYKPIWDALTEGKFRLIVSDDIIYEYVELIQNRSAHGVAAIVMEVFLESPDILLQPVYYSWNLIKNDPDDNKFFDVAVAGNADYLVTNDAHFNILKNLVFPAVKIITANGFLEILEQVQ